MVNGVYYTALFFYWKEESTIFKRVHKRIFHWVVVKKGLFVPKVGLNFLLCIQKFYGCPSWCWATSISMPFSLQGLYLRNFKLLFNYTQIYFHFFIWLKWFLEQKSKRVQIYFPESRFCGTRNGLIRNTSEIFGFFKTWLVKFWKLRNVLIILQIWKKHH